MKRKVAMFGLVMVTGLAHFAYAIETGNEGISDISSYGVSPYMAKYGAAGSARLLMDQLSMPEARLHRSDANGWQMEFVAPPAAYQAHSDAPLTANDKRVGVTFKLDF